MEEWIRVLSELETAIDRMLQIAQEKRKVVVKNDVEALEALVREETGLLARISTLEDKRQRSTVVYALRAGVDPKGATFASLLATLPASGIKDTLSGFRARLVDKMQELERLNRINEELLATQRDIAQFMLESATRPTQLGTQYAGNGRDAETVDSIILVDKNA